MDPLHAQLQRLYCLPNQQPDAATLELIGPDGQVRAMLIRVARATDWAAVATLWEGLQDALELPAPALSVSGEGGYAVWLSLATPVPATEARAFLHGLRDRFLAGLSADALALLPDAVPESAALKPVPALEPASGRWSAFIDPEMGSLFVDEPGLAMAPNPDRQADLLAGLESIQAADFRRVLDGFRQPPANAHADPRADLPAGSGDDTAPGDRLELGGGFTDPKDFLLAVMNAPTASAAQRIEAAKALLPYFGSGTR